MVITLYEATLHYNVVRWTESKLAKNLEVIVTRVLSQLPANPVVNYRSQIYTPLVKQTLPQSKIFKGDRRTIILGL